MSASSTLIRWMERGMALALVPLFVVACDRSPPPEMDPMDEPMAEPADAPMPEIEEETVPLEEVNGSGVSGEAVTMWSADAVVVAVDVTGLPDEGEYNAHIHEGTCEDGGPVAVGLNPVIGLADGTGSSTTTLDLDEVPTAASLFVQVHSQEGPPIACGDME